ncbi:MAG: InlB B-repeat-containing protein [Peptococcaceae bacterium]|nr:InlB B-repeat-containing protein [Peptococcaceae bacterium]
MKPKSHWLAFLFPFALVLFLSAHCFIPSAFAETGDGNLIPNGDFEAYIPFGNLGGNIALNGTNTFTLETDSSNLNTAEGIDNGTAALKIEQNTRNAFAGYKLSLERDCTYQIDFDVMLLHDSDGNPVSNLDVVRNFVFTDQKATNFNQNHIAALKKMSTADGWQHVTGSYTASSTDAAADFANAYFAIYVQGPGAASEGKSVTYVIDNVRLTTAAQPDVNLIPNGNFELPLQFGNLGGNVTLNGTNAFILETDVAALNTAEGIDNGTIALKIAQNTRNAFAGYKLSLERDCTYQIDFDVMLLHDSDGNPVSNLDVVRNFVFTDQKATNFNQNHIAALKKMSTADGWQHVTGSYTASSTDAEADFANAYFAIYVQGPGAASESKSVTYVIDNVRLAKKTYTVTFHANGGLDAPADFSVSHSNEVTQLPDSEPWCPDHYFLGWAESIDAAEPLYYCGQNIGEMPLRRDLDLYAVWQLIPPPVIDGPIPSGDGNLIPNGDFEAYIPFGNLGGNIALNGTNTFTLETDSSNLNTAEGIDNGTAALKIEQNTRNAFAGYKLSLERDCTYQIDFDVMLLHDSDGNPVSNLDVVRNFVFTDQKATNFNQNHIAALKKMSTADGWQHVTGSYTASSTDAAADFANAYFAIYVQGPGAASEGKSVTYVIDNVRLTTAAQPDVNLIPNGNFELPLQFGNLGGNVTLNGTNAFILETDVAALNTAEGIDNGTIALKIAQNTRNAFAGYKLSLERDCTYQIDFDVMLLHDSDGNPVSNLDVVRNFVFTDQKATNFNQNHIAALKKMSTADGWQHVTGSYTASSTDAEADFANAYFAIYVQGPGAASESKSVTYVIDNVRLAKKTYTVTFHANGGLDAPADFSVSHSNEVTQLPDSEPWRPDHYFLGWAESIDAAEPLYFAGHDIGIMPLRWDLNLYAVWKLIPPPVINDPVPNDDGNLIPNGDFEAFLPFGNLVGGNTSLNGTNTVTLETGSANANVYEGNASLRIQQNTRNAFAGCPVSLERGKTYDYGFWIKLLHDSNGSPVHTDASFRNVVANFVFADKKATNYEQNHIFGLKSLSTTDEWQYVTGSYTVDSAKLDPGATPEDAFFSIYIHGPGTPAEKISVTYVVDNIWLSNTERPDVNLIPNGTFELLSPFQNLSGNVSGGSNTFAIDNDTAHLNMTNGVKNGNAALRIQQTTNTAFAGYPIVFERDYTYDFEYDIMVLQDADGNNVSNLNSVTNFVFRDAKSHNGQNHFTTVPSVPLSTGGGWRHVAGSRTLRSTDIDAAATLENGYFAVYLDATPGPERKPVTYLLDNVRLLKRAFCTIVGQQPLNIFTTGDPFAFDIKLTNTVNTDVQIAWRITDYFGNPVGNGTTVIPAGQAMASVSQAPKNPGHYLVEVWAPGEKGSVKFAGETVRGNFAVVNENRTSLEDSPFGMHTYFSWYDSSGAGSRPFIVDYNVGDTNRSLLGGYARALELSGITWVREVATWKQMELYERHGGASQYVHYNNAYSSRGINVLETILATPNPTWIASLTPERKALLTETAKNAMSPASEALGNKLPDDLTAAYEAGRDIGYFYRDMVSMWEVFNEPDGGLGSGPSEGADKYAAFMKAMSIGFHESGIPVAMGGLVTRSADDYKQTGKKNLISQYKAYQETLFRNGIIDYSEIYNFHNHQNNIDPIQDNPLTRSWYNLAVTDNNVFSVNRNLDHLERRNTLDVGMPAWVTEAGGGIANSPLGLDDDYNKQKVQARYLVTSAAMSLSTGVDKHFWFSGREALENQRPYRNVYWSSFSQYNPFEEQITPYAAFAAQAAMTKALGQAKYLGEIKVGAGYLPTGSKGYAFDDGSGNTVLVLWADNSVSTTLSLQKQSGIQTNIMGEEQPIPGNGGFALQLGPDPIYLCVPGSLPPGMYKDTISAHTPVNHSLKSLTAEQKIVLDQTYEVKCRANASSNGYSIKANDQITVIVTIYNFNDTPINGTVTGMFDAAGQTAGYIVSGPQATQTIPAGGKQNLTFTVKAPGQTSNSVYLSFVGNFNGIGIGKATTPSVSMVRTVAGY